MEIPISIILIIFLVLVTFFILFSGVLLYHAFRFGVATGTNIFTILLYLVISLILIMSAYTYVTGIDWTQSIKII